VSKRNAGQPSVSEPGAGNPGHPVGLYPVPGDGVLARRGNLILLCSLNVSQFADQLLDLLEQAADAGDDGRRFTDAVAAAVEATDAEAGHSVLAFGPAGHGIAVTVSGGAWADVTTAQGTARVEAGHPSMLLRCVLRTAIGGVRGGLSPSDNGAASTDRFSRLEAGTMRAGGLSFYQAGAAAGPARATEQSPAAEPADEEPAVPESLAARSFAARSFAAEPGAESEPYAAEPFAAEPEPYAAEPFAAEPFAAEPFADEPEPLAAEPEPSAAEPERVQFEKAPDEPAAPPAGAEPVLESTAAWVPDDVPASSDLSERQATELWTPPPGSGPQEQPPEPAASGPAGAQAGQAAPEPDVTEPPEPFYAGAPGPPAEPYSSGQPFEAILLGGAPGAAMPVESRQPLAKIRELPPGTSSYVSAGPIIQGVYCKNGHFDDPEARFCAVCGISMNQQTLVPRPGERPPLGVLLLDDGSVFQLDRDYVVGREPSLDASVASGHARALRVADESGIVSRVHARVALDGWRVLVTDLGSANGTRVFLPGQPADQQLVPQVPIVLGPGSQVDLGGRGFRYESHRGR
jgi:FHA domain